MRGVIETIAALGLVPPSGVLQVGASIGQELEYFYGHGIRFGAFIEPLDEPFAILRQRLVNIEGYLPIQTLCGARDGDEVQFHIASNFGQSSSLLAPSGHLTDYPRVSFSEKRTMTTFTLDRVFATVQSHRPEVAREINLLYMDVQGAELQILKGASAVLQRVDHIYTEVGMGGSYDDDVLFEDIIMYLKAYGFRLVTAEMGPEGWGEAMFTRRTGRHWGRG